jgi:hypothetical protein
MPREALRSRYDSKELQYLRKFQLKVSRWFEDGYYYITNTAGGELFAMEVSFQLADVVEEAKEMKEYLKAYVNYIKYEMRHGNIVPSRDLVYFFEKIDKDKELLVIMDYHITEGEIAGTRVSATGGEICKILKVKKEVLGDPIDEDLLEELMDWVLIEREDWDLFWSYFDRD